MLPLLRILDLGFEIGGGTAVWTDEDGVLWGREQAPDALVVPRVGARGYEQTLAGLHRVGFC